MAENPYLALAGSKPDANPEQGGNPYMRLAGGKITDLPPVRAITSPEGQDMLATLGDILGDQPAARSSMPELGLRAVPEAETPKQAAKREARNLTGSVFGKLSGDVSRTWAELGGDAMDSLRIGARQLTRGALELANAPQHVINVVNSSANGWADMLGMGGGRIPMLPSYDWVRGTQAEIQNEADRIKGGLSAKAQAENAEFDQTDGLVGSLGYLASHPSAAFRTGLEQVPQVLPALTPVGLGGRIAMQGTVAGGMTGADIAAANQQRVVNGEITQAQADALTAQGAIASAAMNTAIPMKFDGAQTIERVLAGARGTGAGRIAGGLRGALGEGLGEAGTEGLDQAIQNEATGRPFGEGVGKAAAMGAAMGGPLGGLAGVVEGGPHPAIIAHASVPNAPNATPREDILRSGAIDPGILAAGNAALRDAHIVTPVAPNAAPRSQQAQPAQSPPTELGTIHPDLTPREPAAQQVPEGATRDSLIEAWRSAATPEEQTQAAGRIAAFDIAQRQRSELGGMPAPVLDTAVLDAALGDIAPPVAPPSASPAIDFAALAQAIGLPPESAASPEVLPPSAPEAGPQNISTPSDTTMQNRDRKRAASVAQMQDIRRNPDAERLGFSRDPNTGAPMVGEGAQIPDADKGRADFVKEPDGTKTPVRYAVVEADSLAASHDADGNENPNYASTPLKALSNGRTAGLQAAYSSGHADAYRAGIMADAELHGVPREAIASKRKPVLVRLYDPSLNTGDMGARSNASQQLGLSPVEQAQTDARALPDLSGLEWNEDGSISPARNANFFRAWFGKLGATQAANLQDRNGHANAMALQRVRAALVQRAYGDERLLSALTEDVDSDNRNVVNALARAAPGFAKLDDTPYAKGVKAALTGGMQILRDAKARGLSIEDALAQQDMFGRNPDADSVAQYMAGNAKSAKRMAEAFAAIAEYAARAEQQAATLDVFGNSPQHTTTDALRSAGILENEYGTAAGNDARSVREGNGSREQAGRGRTDTGDAGGFELASQPATDARADTQRVDQSGLFAPPTAQEHNRAASEAKDAQRNGLGRDVVRPEQGDGELLAGGRPAQARVDEASESRQRGNILESTATNSTQISSKSSGGQRTQRDSIQQGSDDADAMGMREAVRAVIGDIPVTFLHGMEGLPTRLRNRLERKLAQRGGKGRTAGLFDPKTRRAYVFTDVVKSAEDAAFVAAHEVAGHKGLRALAGDKLAYWLKRAAQNPTVRKVAAEIAKQRKMKPEQWTLSIEEALSELSAAARTGDWSKIATRYKVDVSKTLQSSVRAALENFLRKLKELIGLHINQRFSDAQVRQLLEASFKAAQNDGATTGEAAMESVDNGGMAEDDYHGEHSAPMKDSGAPGHDVTGGGNFYPDDVYGPNGLRYYGTGYDAMDAEAYGHIKRLKNHQNHQITVYRAVPKSVKGGIKAGDWVTTVRRYALDHGRGALNGDYKIQSKIVRANEIFTNGDSWLEWGYDPQPFDMDDYRAARERRAEKQRQNEALESTEDQTQSDALESVEDDAEPFELTPPTPKLTPVERGFARRGALFGKLAADGMPLGPVTQAPNGRLQSARVWGDALRRNLQDKMIDVLRMQETASESGKGVTGIGLDDAMNAYALETLSHGSIKNAMTALEQQHVAPIQKALRDSHYSVDQFVDYLFAKAAPERNAAIAKINRAMPDAGSGITTKMANGVLAGKEAGPYSGKVLTPEAIALFDTLIPHIRAMRDMALDNAVAAGQITQRMADTLRAKYPNYVPMRGKDDVLDAARGTGKGLSQSSAGIKRAGGRGEGNLPQDIFGEIVGDAQRSIIAKGKAGPAKALLRFALEHPMPDVYEIEPIDMEWRFSEVTGEAYLAVKNAASDDTSMVVYHDGTPVRLRFHDKRLQEAVMNMGPEDMKTVVKVLGVLNRWRSAVLTRYNPGFMPVNILRDLHFGLAAIAAEHGAGAAARALRLYPSAMAASARHVMHQRGDASKADADKTMDDWVAEAYDMGISTGIALSESPKDLQRKAAEGAAGIMELAASGKKWAAVREAVGRTGKPILDLIEAGNEATEMALRISTYVEQRKRGISKLKAAEYAKNVTINFNRKGRFGSVLNAFYLFYNASIQGTHAVLRVMRNPKVVAHLVALGAAQAWLAMGMMGDDDDKDGITEWDKIPDWVKRTSFVIPIGKDHYAAIPMPYGFNVFTYLGGRGAQRIQLGDRPRDTSIMADVLSSMTEAFSPVPIGEGYRSLFGDQFGFMFGLAMNRDDLGRPISKETPFQDYDTPKASQGKVTTPRAYFAVAQMLSKLGGANLDEKIPPVGFLDVSPEQLEAITNYMGGGIASLANKGLSWQEQLAAGNLGSGMDVASAMPIVGRMFGKKNDARAVADWYYGEKGEFARHRDIMMEKVAAGMSLDAAKATRPSEYVDGIEQAEYKRKGKRKDGSKYEVGDLRVDAGGRPVIAEAPDGLVKANKDVAQRVKSINSLINDLRAGGVTNGELAGAYKKQHLIATQTVGPVGMPVGVTGGHQDLGLPTGYTEDAEVPARVKTRAIKLLQDIRTAEEKRVLRRLRMHRENAAQWQALQAAESR